MPPARLAVSRRRIRTVTLELPTHLLLRLAVSRAGLPGVLGDLQAGGNPDAVEASDPPDQLVEHLEAGRAADELGVQGQAEIAVHRVGCRELLLP